MNRLVVATCGVLAGVALQGCSSDPSLVSGNRRGGIISNVNVSDKAAVLALADGHCRQYGEVGDIIHPSIQKPGSRRVLSSWKRL